MSRVVDLDALYGQDNPLAIRWQGKEYELLRPAALGPVAVARLGRLQRKMGDLAGDLSDITDAQAAELEEIIDGLLAIVCPGLIGLALPFAAKQKIVESYTNWVNGEALEASPNPASPPTGATSTAG